MVSLVFLLETILLLLCSPRITLPVYSWIAQHFLCSLYTPVNMQQTSGIMLPIYWWIAQLEILVIFFYHDYNQEKQLDTNLGAMILF